MPGLSELKVLIVDDNDQMRMLVRSMLRAAGITQCAEAENVDQGVEALRALGADIVLLDLAMKPTDGIEFVRRVRRMQGSPNPFVSIIMMTCHSQRSHVAIARDAGVNSFLAKPISGRSLIEHIIGVIQDGRAFVRADTFFGPDRRRAVARDYAGPWRRQGEPSRPGEDFDLDAAYAPAPRAVAAHARAV